MVITLRRAEEADLGAILRLYAELASANEPILPLARAREILRRMAEYPDYSIYVAEGPAKTILGSFALLIMDNLAHMGAPSAVVEDVCVDRLAQRQGVGRQMMAFAMNLARQRGCYKLCLSSNLARSDAHAFYGALGFEQHGLSFHVQLK